MRVPGAIAAVAISAAVAYGGPADKARADKLFEDGRKYLATKEYALACTAFEQSQAADPAIGTELNIALCYEQWGKIASAYRAYVEAERLSLLKKDNRAKATRKKIDELAAKVPHLTIAVLPDADPGAVVLLDGKELELGKLAADLELDPGSHLVEARVAGKPPSSSSVDLAPGEHRRLELDLSPPPVVVVVAPPPRPVVAPLVEHRSTGKLYGGLALAVTGGLAVVVSGVVAIAARQDYANNVKDCPMLVCTTRAAFDATQHARSRANLMTFVGGGGLALAGIGIFLIATSKTTQREATHAQLVPMISPDGIGLSIGGAL